MVVPIEVERVARTASPNEADAPAVEWRVDEPTRRTARTRFAALAQLARRARTKVWDERGWGSRIALLGAAATVVVPGTGAAGIAALGAATRVPLWLLGGAGGALVGTVVAEATALLARSRGGRRGADGEAAAHGAPRLVVIPGGLEKLTRDRPGSR